jgi:hypothetical protein
MRPKLPDPLVVRDMPQRPLPGVVWLLVGGVILAFALGILLVTSGLLRGTESQLPGPTAFTLTPQITITPGG